jgi:hypothetical protein
MVMAFEELDDTTREYMLREFEDEESSGNPYRGQNLSPQGRAAFPDLMREAIAGGTEETLARALQDARYWNRREHYVTRQGRAAQRDVNINQAAERLATSEFNTWYVRGLCRRLLDEGVSQCQAYRAAEPKWEHGECARYEGEVFDVEEIYAGHRARYWPPPGDATAVSIPFTPGCHHTIRRHA